MKNTFVDSILPFQVDDKNLRGRFARIDRLASDTLKNHRFPDKVCKLYQGIDDVLLYLKLTSLFVQSDLLDFYHQSGMVKLSLKNCFSYTSFLFSGY